MMEIDEDEKIIVGIDDYERYNNISNESNHVLVFSDDGKEYTVNDVESYFFIPKFSTSLDTRLFGKVVKADITNFYIGIKAINKEHACRFLASQLSQDNLDYFYITKQKPVKLLPLVLVKNSYDYELYDNYCEPFPELFEC